MRKVNAGVAMMEVLISMGIIALVLLSLFCYQISMIKGVDQSRFKTIALVQLNNFSEMLRIYKTNSQQKSVMRMWNKDNARLLPHGIGMIKTVDDHICKINIRWFFKKSDSESLIVFC
jgi:Tfp pilus assembly protein PilV